MSDLPQVRKDLQGCADPSGTERGNSHPVGQSHSAGSLPEASLLDGVFYNFLSQALHSCSYLGEVLGFLVL